jgi:FkbM family methyltransferase
MKLKDFSQHGEQKLLEGWFKKHKPKNKFLVDIGAYGLELSNTYALIRRGWEGLLVEPNKQRYEELVKNLKGYKVAIANCGAGRGTCRIPLYIHKVGGHDSFLKEWGHSELTGEEPLTMVYPLTEILRDWGCPSRIDLLSIDTEGMDFWIMEKFLKDGVYRAEVIITESESYTEPREFFGGYGYRFLAHLGDKILGNDIFVSQG